MSLREMCVIAFRLHTGELTELKYSLSSRAEYFFATPTQNYDL